MHFELLESYELAPFIASLRALEQSITYPLDEDTFTINHGEFYHDFFSRKGTSRFLVATAEQGSHEVLGTLAGIWHKALHHDTSTSSFNALYLGDLKLDPSMRGQSVIQRMLWFAMRRFVVEPRLGHWDLVYGAAMRGANGDVTRSIRGAHMGHLLQPMARLSLYFATPKQLANLDLRRCPKPPKQPGWTLGANTDPMLVRNDGIKQMHLQSQREIWSLTHLNHGPAQWPVHLGDTLRRAHLQMRASHQDNALCFALDQRLDDHHQWCASQGIHPGAMCTIYGLNMTHHTPSWVHLCPAEI